MNTKGCQRHITLRQGGPNTREDWLDALELVLEVVQRPSVPTRWAPKRSGSKRRSCGTSRLFPRRHLMTDRTCRVASIRLAGVTRLRSGLLDEPRPSRRSDIPSMV